MAATVDYYMTPVSPFTYMGHERLRAICRDRGAEINLRVMDLGKVFPASGGLRAQGSSRRSGAPTG